MEAAIIYFKKLLNLKVLPVQQLGLSDDQLLYIYQQHAGIAHPVAMQAKKYAAWCICHCQ